MVEETTEPIKLRRDQAMDSMTAGVDSAHTIETKLLEVSCYSASFTSIDVQASGDPLSIRQGKLIKLTVE